jgi:hypothetical protein
MRHFRFINLNDPTGPPPLHDNLCAADLYAMSFPMNVHKISSSASIIIMGVTYGE